MDVSEADSAGRSLPLAHRQRDWVAFPAAAPREGMGEKGQRGLQSLRRARPRDLTLIGLDSN